MNLSKFGLDRLRGYKLDDEDVAYIIDVLSPGLADHGISFRKTLSPTEEKIMDWLREADEELESSLKEEKELWKIGYEINYNVLSCNGLFDVSRVHKESDVKELTTSEAKEWFQQFHRENPYAGLFKLYHKKAGEWVLYEEAELDDLK